MPTVSPLGPTSRTSGTRIRSLIRSSVLMCPPGWQWCPEDLSPPGTWAGQDERPPLVQAEASHDTPPPPRPQPRGHDALQDRTRRPAAVDAGGGRVVRCPRLGDPPRRAHVVRRVAVTIGQRRMLPETFRWRRNPVAAVGTHVPRLGRGLLPGPGRCGRWRSRRPPSPGSGRSSPTGDGARQPVCAGVALVVLPFAAAVHRHPDPGCCGSWTRSTAWATGLVFSPLMWAGLALLGALGVAVRRRAVAGPAPVAAPAQASGRGPGHLGRSTPRWRRSRRSCATAESPDAALVRRPEPSRGPAERRGPARGAGPAEPRSAWSTSTRSTRTRRTSSGGPAASRSGWPPSRCGCRRWSAARWIDDGFRGVLCYSLAEALWLHGSRSTTTSWSPTRPSTGPRWTRWWPPPPRPPRSR